MPTEAPTRERPSLASFGPVRSRGDRPPLPGGAGAGESGGRRVSGWVALACWGWLVGEALGALVVTWSASRLLPQGTASGVAAAEALLGTPVAVMASSSLAALAIWRVPVWAVQIGVVTLATTGRGRSWRSDLGLIVRPVDLLIGAGAGLCAQVLISVVYAGLGIEAEGPARQLVAKGDGPLGLVALVVLLAVVAPVVEELLFRGVLQNGLAGRMPAPAALVVASALFALVHLQAVQFPGLFVAGLVFGGLLVRTGRLGPSLFAHMAFNLSTVLFLALR